MKISRYFLIILISCHSLLANANLESSEKNLLSLNLNVKNIKHDKGSILIAIYNKEEEFMKERYADKSVKVDALENLKVELQLPPGRYAITIFHDINDNNELNTNIIGIPKEPYGFSNNPKITFGPPNFKQASFDFTLPSQDIEIVLK
jgi:uncharacterized protein (DUF2141 family)